MKIPIVGSFPSPIYRAFDEDSYSRDFTEYGIFRLLPLAHYCKIEDIKRKDPEEGEGKSTLIMNRPIFTLDSRTCVTLKETSEIGPVCFGTSSINPRYILSFCGPHADMNHIASTYGPYVIRINRPNELVSDIMTFLSKNLAKTMYIDCVKVRYDKNKILRDLPDPATFDRSRMAYSQKSPIFSKDCEYRLVVTLPLNLESYPVKIDIDLQKKLRYVERVIF